MKPFRPTWPAPAEGGPFPAIKTLRARRYLPSEFSSLLSLMPHCVPEESTQALARFRPGSDPVAWPAWWVLVDGALAGFVSYQVRPQDACIRFLNLHPVLRNPEGLRRVLAFVAQQTQVPPSVLLRERDVPPQVFLRTLGWRCVSTHKGWFRASDSNEPQWPNEPQDAWLFKAPDGLEAASCVLHEPEPSLVATAAVSV